MSSDDIVKQAAKGLTEAALDWSSSKIQSLVTQFLQKNLAFIEDQEVIDLAKEQRKTGEWNLFKQYVKDTRLRILFQMGLTLRRLEKQGKDIKPLQDKILDKYDIEGLHVAYFVQNGLFSKYMGHILESVKTERRLTLELEKLFNNIDNAVIFIRKADEVFAIAEIVVTKIRVLSPRTFIISACHSEAMEKCRKVKNHVMNKISGYECELYESKNKEIYFLNLIDLGIEN